MGNNKSCIFHVPNHIDINAKSGSHIRPIKMIEAFRENGYDVDIVMGYGKERKRQIDEIRKKIRAGKKYDFLYSESSTMPTLLTEKNHLPLYPNLDFGFLKFCRKNGIKIGLFYRDIHWKFEKYRSEVSVFKRSFSIPMYKYDLRKYKKLVDVFYLPSEKMKEQIKEYEFQNIKPLPSGATEDLEVIKKREEYFSNRETDKLNLFYVGGIEGIYNLTPVLKAIKEEKRIYMTICCRKNEWEKMRSVYEPYLTDRIQIVHAFGEELKQYYLKSDICSCIFQKSEYMSFAVPIKFFEYMSYVTPIIATKETTAGDFLECRGNGISISPEPDEIRKTLEFILENEEILIEMHKKAIKCLEQNTWKKRAYQVAVQLKGE